MFPSRGGADLLINSICVGSLADAIRRTGTKSIRESRMSCMHFIPSLASSSRIGTPPISKITRPVGTLGLS